MKRIRTPFGVLVVAAFLVAGCGGDDDAVAGDPSADDGAGDDSGGDSDGDFDGPDTDDGADDVSLEGAWVLRNGHLDGEEIAIVDGWDVTLNIADGRVDGTAACNGYGGTVDIGAEFGLGGAFVVGELGWTEMGCAPEVMELEQEFLAALQEVDWYELAETLLLGRHGVGTDLRFERVEPVADAELVGTTWVLDTLITGDAASNPPGMSASFLEFSDDGTLVGSTGCRRLEGEWLLDDAVIRIPILSAIDDPAAGACAPESDALDGEVIAVLESGVAVEIEGNRLTLTAPGGDGLSFIATGGVD